MNSRSSLRVFSFSILAVLCPMLFSSTPASGAEAKLTTGQHIADVNGIKFAYFVAGKGPLMIVQSPGWGIGSAVLRNGLGPLESKFTLVFYDTRGSGLSSRPSDETKMSTSDMVDDLDGLRQYWGIPTITLLGHSHGGTIALGYAIRYPKRVKKLILVGADILDFDNSAIVRQGWEARKGDKRYESAIQAAMSLQDPKSTSDDDPGTLVKQMMPLYFYDPEKNLPILFKAAPEGPSVWVMNANRAADEKSPMKQDSLMNQVEADTLIIAGRSDFPVFPVVAERIHTAIPHSQIRVLEKCGHFPWIEVPQDFFPEVTRFAEK